jgi:predicted ribosome quality control (RQC) complex YloA/Tae2 family protein
VKKDHEQRITNLEKSQIEDTKKAELITRNQERVDDTIMALRQVIASQMSWTDVENVVKEAKKSGDPKASIIKHLKLQINHITLLLSYVPRSCFRVSALYFFFVDINLFLW